MKNRNNAVYKPGPGQQLFLAILLAKSPSTTFLQGSWALVLDSLRQLLDLAPDLLTLLTSGVAKAGDLPALVTSLWPQ